MQPGVLLAIVLAHAGYVSLAAYLERSLSPRSGATRADAVTLARTSLGATLIAYAIDAPNGASYAWTAIVVATCSAVLDAVDGALARRDANASAFGAWFDQETDALFVLVLSACVWRSGHAGAWALLAGTWRYAFLALRAAIPRLRGALDEWRPRRVMCVTQIVVLIVALVPFLPAPATHILVFTSICLLSASFTRDLVTLWRNGRPDETPSRIGSRHFT